LALRLAVFLCFGSSLFLCAAKFVHVHIFDFWFLVLSLSLAVVAFEGGLSSSLGILDVRDRCVAVVVDSGLFLTVVGVDGI
jgi:hypothetical protein